MIANGYLTLTELKTTLGSSSSGTDADYELAIESASRWIDDRCSDVHNGRVRHFYQDPSSSTRLYRAETVHLVRTSDFASADDTTVEVQAADGTWSALNASSWQPEPLVRLDGHPYTQITAESYSTLFPLDLKPRVRVTARWGWAAVPKPVKQACQILAVANMLGKDVISNEDGYSVGSRGPTDPFGLAENLLMPYLAESEQKRLVALEEHITRGRR